MAKDGHTLAPMDVELVTDYGFVFGLTTIQEDSEGNVHKITLHITPDGRYQFIFSNNMLGCRGRAPRPFVRKG